MTTAPNIRLFTAKHAAILSVVAVLMAFAINAIFGVEPLLSIARKGDPLTRQLWIGAIIGSSLAFLSLAAFTIGARYIKGLAALRDQMFALLSRVDLSGMNPLLIGAMAGLWEEVLFRAALQPIVGIWWAALIFTLCHTGTGQFLSMNWKKAVYAVGVFAAGVMLGEIFARIGLVAAIATHAAIDIIGLYAMRHQIKAAARATQADQSLTSST